MRAGTTRPGARAYTTITTCQCESEPGHWQIQVSDNHHDWGGIPPQFARVLGLRGQLDWQECKCPGGLVPPTRRAGSEPQRPYFDQAHIRLIGIGPGAIHLVALCHKSPAPPLPKQICVSQIHNIIVILENSAICMHYENLKLDKEDLKYLTINWMFA